MQADESVGPRSLRLWPGVAIVALMWLFRFGLPSLFPETLVFGLYGVLVGGLGILLWWLFFSRAPRIERWSGAALIVVALAGTPWILHPSLRTAMAGLVFILYAIPVLTLAFVAWAVAGPRLPDRWRRVTMVSTILLACGGWALVRTHGVAGGFDWDFAWRWSDTPEQRLLRQRDEPVQLVARAVTESGFAWPGFRGPGRNGIVRGLRIETDWSSFPPVELWRRPVGPGWSSIAVAGDLLYTQEQRGEEEIVSCYRVSTGEPVWRHRDPVRFWEAMAGAGPRATPTVSDGRVYSVGAKGILNALDAESGALEWSRDLVADIGVRVPNFGFAGSPLVADDTVFVSTTGRLAAYDRASGALRWVGATAGDADSLFYESYSSPHMLTIDGVAQILLMSGSGLAGFAPDDGAPLWEHAWPGLYMLQPALVEGGDLLFSSSDSAKGRGMRRLTVVRDSGGWSVDERWTSDGLKPYFNDFVVHAGHAFGFDGGSLACIDLADGERTWRGERFGLGQLVLLPDQDLLLVQSEKGALALVQATPKRYREIARFVALGSKAWSHPVVVGDLLLVRNDREMAAFRLTLR